MFGAHLLLFAAFSMSSGFAQGPGGPGPGGPGPGGPGPGGPGPGGPGPGGPGPGGPGPGLPIFVPSPAPPPREPAPRPRPEYVSSVYQVQKALRGLGYYYGALDGVSGPATRAAIYNFRMDKGLPPGSMIDGHLLEALR
jgi:hypothetical protein